MLIFAVYGGWMLALSSKLYGKIKNDIDALMMTQNVDSTREVYVCVRISGCANAGGFDEHGNRDNACHVEHYRPEELRDADRDLNSRLLNMGKDNNQKHDEEDSEIHNYEQSFSNDSDVKARDIGATYREIVSVSGAPSNLRSNDKQLALGLHE